MDSADRSGMAEWVARWQTAGPTLAAIRARELDAVDVPRFIAAMEDAFRAARSAPSAPMSGLVIQQRLFARLGL